MYVHRIIGFDYLVDYDQRFTLLLPFCKVFQRIARGAFDDRLVT